MDIPVDYSTNVCFREEHEYVGVRIASHESSSGIGIGALLTPLCAFPELSVLFRYIFWTTPEGAEDGFETSAA